MLVEPIAFPKILPEGFALNENEPQFDPKRHLALEPPKQLWRLQDFGYSREAIASVPTDIAVAGPFRILSPEGAACLREVARNLIPFILKNVGRIPSRLRGGAYRSRFVRDFSQSPEVTNFLSSIFKVPLAPHTMPMHLAHMNFAPDNLEAEVDRWHADMVGFDYVMMVTDPVPGGRFQFFLGTREEANSLRAAGKEIPAARIVTPEIPAGFAVFQQGGFVMHRASRLTERAERISLVNSYVCRDIACPDPNRYAKLLGIDPDHVVFAEWARHKAWIARGKLDQLIAELPFTKDRMQIAQALEQAIEDVVLAIQDIREPEFAGREPQDPPRLRFPQPLVPE